MDSETEERPSEEAGEPAHAPDSALISTPPVVPVVPIVPTVSDPVNIHRRQTRLRNIDNAGLPSSFAALRPASLPNLSSVPRPPPREDPADRPRSHALRDFVLGAEAESKRNKPNGDRTPIVFDPKEIDEALGPREEEILRLVAASTPSHRNAWKKGSKAWQLFVHRHDNKVKPGAAKGTIPEEDEFDADLDEHIDDQSDSLEDTDTDNGDDVHKGEPGDPTW